MTSPNTGILLDETRQQRNPDYHVRRRACHGNAFDAILSDGVLQLIDISGEGWPIALLPFGNFLRFGLRTLWRMNPAGFDRLLLALAKRLSSVHHRDAGGAPSCGCCQCDCTMKPWWQL
jgi:hypothetical protein